MAVFWTKDMVIDNGIIDADHQVLIEIIKEFEKVSQRSADRATIAGLLTKLERYTEMHFVREERLQQLVDFGLRFPHHKSHQRLIVEIKVLKEQLRETSDDGLQPLTREIGDFLGRWITKHVLQEDMKMQPYVAEMKKQKSEKKSLQELVQEKQAVKQARKRAQCGPA